MPAEGARLGRRRRGPCSPRRRGAQSRSSTQRSGVRLRRVWTPDPSNRPQVEAYESKADLLLYGGAAGGGKTDLLIGLAVTRHKRSVIFRRAYGDLDGIEQRLIEILGGREGYNGSRHGAAAGRDACSSSVRWNGGAPNSPGRAGRTTSSASTRARSSTSARCAS